MEYSADSLKISYINIRGQTGFTIEKQYQVEEFLRVSNSDILHLQEVNIDDNTFKECNYIESHFTVISNNAENKYGTASIIRNSLSIENVMCDTAGRILVFEISGITFGNFYLPSGTDAASRNLRENYFSEIIPTMLVNRRVTGCFGGDFNSITDKSDATNHQESKLSSCLSRLIRLFDLKDSFRTLHPRLSIYSRYYQIRGVPGATRIDRQYHWGNIVPLSADYVPVAFSDHQAHSVKILLPEVMSKLYSPKSRSLFKIREEVIKDQVFQDRVKAAMQEWSEVKQEGLAVLTWWELIVKPGIRKFALERSKEINQDRRGKLNLLLLRQAYLVKKLQNSELQLWGEKIAELADVQDQIQSWYQEVAKKVQHQARVDEFQENESTRIYHHEIHKKHLKKSSILKLQTDTGVIEGHTACSKYLENLVADLLLKPPNLDSEAQEILLNEIEPEVSIAENEMLDTIPGKKEVEETLRSANFKAAPGTDGISSLLYKICWEFMGEALTEVTQAMHNGETLPTSMRTAMMIFGTKPKKPNSIEPKDKRRISLLNCDFKLLESLYARRFKKISNRLLSKVQYVAGTDRNIHHGISRARDAIFSVSKSKLGCGIADTDFVAAFDWLVLSWVWQVMRKMGVQERVIRRMKSLYADSIAVVIVNNTMGRVMRDMRGSLRQGGCASMEWFAVGIDPLIRYLEKRLSGIPVYTLPVHGPSLLHEPVPLPPLEERFKIMAYCDDVKPCVTTMAEFFTIDRACTLFEKSSGCKLHRGIGSGKCKFLPLGRWRGTLEQQDIPLRYMELAESLDMVGVVLKATWTQTKKANGDLIQTKINNKINSWRAGKFMDLSSRPWSLNSYALSKMWFKCHTVDLRIMDIASVTSKMKSWLFQDQLEKPEEMILHRPVSMGGLGLHHVRTKALATMIRTFIETAAHPRYHHNVYHTALFRAYVLDDNTIPPPPLPPYYPPSFFATIKKVKDNTPLNVNTMTTANWYRLLLEQEITMQELDDHTMEFIKSRAELAAPAADWEQIWRRARLRGLGSEAISFLWKLLHRLLPTEERLARILQNYSESCKLCPAPVPADLVHCFFQCTSTARVGQGLLLLVQTHDPAVTPEKFLRLDFQCEASLELPIVWIVSHTLLYMWETRRGGKIVDHRQTRASLERKISTLRETRHRNACTLIEEILDRNL